MAQQAPRPVGRSQARAYVKYGTVAARRITLLTGFNVVLSVVTLGTAWATWDMYLKTNDLFEPPRLERKIEPKSAGLGLELHEFAVDATEKRQRDLERAAAP